MAILSRASQSWWFGNVGALQMIPTEAALALIKHEY